MTAPEPTDRDIIATPNIAAPEPLQGSKAHLSALFVWCYRNLFFGLLAIIMSLLAALLIEPPPPIDIKNITIGLAILSATVCMTNTSFSAELRAFSPQRQERLNTIATIIAVLSIMIAALIHNSTFNQLVLWIIIFGAFVAVVVGFRAHLLSLQCRSIYIERLLQAVRLEMRDTYADQLEQDQATLRTRAGTTDHVGDVRI